MKNNRPFRHRLLNTFLLTFILINAQAQLVNNIYYPLCPEGIRSLTECRGDFNNLIYLTDLINKNDTTQLVLYIKPDIPFKMSAPGTADAFRLKANNKEYKLINIKYEYRNVDVEIPYDKQIKTGIYSTFKLNFEKIPSGIKMFDLIEGTNYTATKGWFTINNVVIDTSLDRLLKIKYYTNISRMVKYHLPNDDIISNVINVYGKKRLEKLLFNFLKTDAFDGVDCSRLHDVSHILTTISPEKNIELESTYLLLLNERINKLEDFSNQVQASHLCIAYLKHCARNKKSIKVGYLGNKLDTLLYKRKAYESEITFANKIREEWNKTPLITKTLSIINGDNRFLFETRSEIEYEDYSCKGKVVRIYRYPLFWIQKIPDLWYLWYVDKSDKEDPTFKTKEEAINTALKYLNCD